MDSDLVSYFINGLQYLAQDNNAAAARDNFLYCISLDDGQCDLYRAVAMLDAYADDSPVSADLMGKIYRTLTSWGRMLAAVSDETGSTFPADYFPVWVDLRYLGLKTKSYTKTGIHIGYACALADQDRFDEALQVINAAPQVTPMVQMTTVLIYMKASRWQDVIELGQKLLNPMGHDEYDRPTGQIDTYLQAVAYLLTGVGYAHLGNFVAAADRLRSADAGVVDESGRKSHYIGVGAEVCYYLGLIERAKGDEENAVVYWNNGLAYDRTPKLVAALADPKVTLRQTTAELINQRGSYWDVHSEPDINEIRRAERVENQNVLLEEADAELMAQIGMQEVKAQVRRLKANVAYEQELARRGLDLERKALHLVFSGPPGTGKTTIARVIAKVFAGLGLCTNDHVEEASRADLVGSHEGESLRMTREVIARADGGVLFIDEAYEIVQARNDGHVDPFGTEAMTELMNQMENKRDTLIVIMAGYEADMNRLLATNEGLNSRFPRRITFHSYTPDEIGDIAVQLAQKRHNILPDEARQMFVDVAYRLQGTNHAGKKMLDVAGNGRFVRNVVELAEEFRGERLQGTNLRSLSDEELLVLTPADVAPAIDKELVKHFGASAPTISVPSAAQQQQWHNGGELN